MRISDWSSDVCSSDLVFDRQKLLAFDRFHRTSSPFNALDAAASIRHSASSCKTKKTSDGFSFRSGPGETRERALHRSEEHTSELQSLMRISYAVFCLKKKNT